MKAVPMTSGDASTADRFSFEPALFLTSMPMPLRARYVAIPSPYGRNALPSPAVISVTCAGFCDMAGVPMSAARPRIATVPAVFQAIMRIG